MDPKLEARLNNTEPKCGNCRWWQKKKAAFGYCGASAFAATGEDSFGPCIVTIDLAVCTSWNEKGDDDAA